MFNPKHASYSTECKQYDKLKEAIYSKYLNGLYHHHKHSIRKWNVGRKYGKCKVCMLQTLLESLTSCNYKLFPNGHMYLNILFIMPVSTAATECSHSM